MILLIDLATMAVMHSSGVPLTDLSLVLGDRQPLRVTLLDQGTPVTPSGVRPALAIKTSLTDGTLVLAATNLEPVDDALGLAYVGSLPVNTAELATAMGEAESIELVGELVLIAGDGSQRTSSLIRVRVRRDIMPDDLVPPGEVVANWEEMIARAVVEALPDALKDAGVELMPVVGSSTLSTGPAETPTVVGCYAMEWGDEILAGHLTDHCRLRRITMTYYTDTGATGAHWLRIWRLDGTRYVVAGVAPAVALPANNQPIAWDFTPGVALQRGDKVMLEICTGADADHLVTRTLGLHAVMTPSRDGRGIAASVSYPPVLNQSMAPVMSVIVDYDDGITLGGVEVATARQLDSLGRDVRQSSSVAEAAAQTALQSSAAASSSATNANTSATSAATSATAAQQALAAMPQVDAGGNMAIAGGLAVAGTITATGGVRVPLPSTAQEALSYEALIEQRAADDWRRMAYYMDTLIPSWVTTLVRQMQMSSAYNVNTANVSITDGVYSNDWHDMLVTITPAAGISLSGRSTGAWKFANYLGDHNNSDYAAAVVWRIIGSDKASILLGSTSQGYSSTTNPAAACYAHPLHWADYNHDGADYRYPLLNATNNYTSRDMTPAWQVTIYPTGYLGSTTSCLIRGTDYGRDVGDQLYVWALVPKITYVAVAMAPRQSADHRNVMNRWELFVDGKYVMPMTSLFCGSGHTACVTAKVKAHGASGTYQVGLRMGGMRIDATPALGVTNVWSIMERVVMDGATVKPVPDVAASATEVPAAGGEVTLTVSSTLAEDIYVVNDTMCGHDPSAVWCSQSAEQAPAGGGQITLTVAPNATGQSRQVWAFVGHHYAQAAVIKINQSAQ